MRGTGLPTLGNLLCAAYTENQSLFEKYSL